MFYGIGNYIAGLSTTIISAIHHLIQTVFFFGSADITNLYKDLISVLTTVHAILATRDKYFVLFESVRGHRQQEEVREITAEEVPLHVAPVCNAKRK